jgi:YVTN family beta-propeller protein
MSMHTSAKRVSLEGEMNMARRMIAYTIISLLSIAPASSGETPDASGYHVVKTISVGGTPLWDYVTMDSAMRRLYIGRVERVDVIDVDTGAVVGQVVGFKQAHGVALVPDLRRGFIPDGVENTATIIDLKTLQKIGAVSTGKGADSFAYDEVSKRVFIMNSGDNSATVINAADGVVTGTIPLDGQPEFAVADGRGHVFVNIADKSQIDDIDGKTLEIVHRWSLAPCEGPSGLSMDHKNRRLFSVCDNRMMAVMDANTGKVLATLPIGAGADASLFDPRTENAFASAGGSGILTIVHEDSPDKFRVIDNVITQPGARTMALDTKTHNILLVTAKHGHGATHFNVLPNSFVVLVVGK